MKKTGRKRLLSPAQWKLISALGILLLFLTLGTVCFYFLNDMDEDDYEYGVTKAVFLTVQTVTTVITTFPLPLPSSFPVTKKSYGRLDTEHR